MIPTSDVNRRLQTSLDRLARATSAIRVREDDIARSEANGGSLGELVARIEASVALIEKAAAKVSARLTAAP